VASFTAGSGGALLARVMGPEGTPLILRAAMAGGTGDPSRASQALETLAGADIACVPRPAGAGVTAGASWSVESALPGHRPGWVTPPLIARVTEIAVRFPAASGPPAAPSEHLEAVARAFPSWAEAVASLDRRAGVLASLPSVLGHGDLWAGNLLVEGERLTGMVDWDAWHPRAAPGTDLLHLVATDLRYRAGRSFGSAILARPWRSRAFASASDRYWRNLGVRPDAEVLDGVGIAWWAGQVANSIGRIPELIEDGPWVRENVERVLAAITDWAGA
jgi:aminoglycoside phosphotransferase (APT) family kinase protein